MKRVLLSTLLLSGLSRAADWLEISGNIFIDLDTITANQLWVKHNFKQRGKSVSEISKLEYDCGRRTYRLLKKAHFDESGNSVTRKGVNTASDWQEVIPGTVTEGILTNVCALDAKLAPYKQRNGGLTGPKQAPSPTAVAVNANQPVIVLDQPQPPANPPAATPNQLAAKNEAAFAAIDNSGLAVAPKVIAPKKMSAKARRLNCAQMRKDANYIAQLYKICYARKATTEIRKILAQSNQLQCQFTEAQVLSDNKTIGQTITAKAQKQGFANFCNGEQKYLDKLKAKYKLN